MKKILIGLIRIYQKLLSPFCAGCCRYRPTCSQYMIEALRVHGIFKGLWLGFCRILRCHPWGGSGYDPVPPKKSDQRSLPRKGTESKGKNNA